MNLQLPEGSPPDAALCWLSQLVRDFGSGFHLDTDPVDYVLPDGQPCFTNDQCRTLMESLDRLFRILGDQRPYEIGAEVASMLLAESRGMKPPLHFHDPAFQEQLLSTGSRDELIAWLCWNVPNGVYSDQDSGAEDRPPLTLPEARQLMREQIKRD
jgi:hypothetical protein